MLNQNFSHLRVATLRSSTLSRFYMIVALLLVASFLVVAAGELLAAHCESDCEEHCDESCETCGDCIQCLPNMHMLTGMTSSTALHNPDLEWALPTLSENCDMTIAADIDHPPQNIA